ncbi:nucleolar protein 9 [Microplitis mediator]|uniref:nucleolar protein 9 n=1 Tax=Microplitis mediator TaxID=375433 RepID=UPI002553EFA4|nr:nucleolar protein 9 [Microplitis mediator]
MSEINTTNNTDSDKQGFKRKKKRSANQMAKKLIRRSTRDSIINNELDYDTYQYLIRILEVLRTDFPTMDDKLTFVNNVYDQIVDHEIEYSKNQVGSRVIDSLMDYASLQVIQRFANAFSPSLRLICCDRFGSHVLEKIIHVCADRGNRDDCNHTDLKIKKEDIVITTEDQADEYNKIALKLCKFTINNFEEFTHDHYANHVLRTAIECLGGLFYKIDDKNNNNKTIINNNTNAVYQPRRKVNEDYIELLKISGNRIVDWPQFREFGKDKLTSGLLQTLLYSTQDIDSKLNSKIIKKIMNDCFTSNTDDSLSNIFDNEDSLRLLETCLMVAQPKKFKKIYTTYFESNLKKLTLVKDTNYCVQKLLNFCATKEEFEKIFDEISEHVLEIINKQFMGVLSSLANACLRLQSKQGPFVNVIMKSLGCDESAERQLQLVPLVCRLITYDQWTAAKKDERYKNIAINLHGSLIIQAILQFNKPIKIVNSLLAMSGDELVDLFGDPKGSRILDVFMDSKFVGEKSREKLTKLIKGHWDQLALSVHGSRCLDKFWEYSKQTQRFCIMDELSSVGQGLKASKTGRLIYKKLNVSLYSRDKKQWIESQGKDDKTKALFADIISTSK